jgi:predicted NAD-dependent protein-ADP-ribosyltransferase YbiA (DUF1768 family)
MSGRNCDAICKSGKDKNCENPAVYYVPGKGFRCGSHMRDVEGSKEQYSIKRNGLTIFNKKAEQEDIVIYEDVGGRYALLSNLDESPFDYHHIKWRSVENALQGRRFYWGCSDKKNTEHRLQLVKKIASMPASEVREYAEENKKHERTDWHSGTNGKYTVMERFLFEIMICKFQQYPDALSVLLSTKESKIVVIQGSGQDNKTGEILMLVRSHFFKNKIYQDQSQDYS